MVVTTKLASCVCTHTCIELSESKNVIEKVTKRMEKDEDNVRYIQDRKQMVLAPVTK